MLSYFNFFSFNHYYAVLFKKWIIFKRSWIGYSISLLIAIFISSISILIYHLILNLYDIESTPLTFNSFQKESSKLVFVNDSSFDQSEFIKILSEMYYNETKMNISAFYFDSIPEMNKFTLSLNKNNLEKFHFGSSVSLKRNKYNELGYFLTLFFNNSYREQVESQIVEAIATDALWKIVFGNDGGFEYTNTILYGKVVDYLFGKGRSCIVACGISFFLSYLMSNIINDLSGDSMKYMKSCGLKVCSYWAAAFTIDFLLWIILVSIIWVLFYIDKSPTFEYSGLYIFLAMVMSGPSVLLFLYSISYFIGSRNNGPRHIFIAFMGLVFTQNVIEFVSNERDPPFGEEIICSLIPPIQFYRSFFVTAKSKLSDNFPLLFDENLEKKQLKLYFIISFTNPLLYSIILMIIEKFKDKISLKITKSKFQKNIEYVLSQTQNFIKTEEIKAMEEDVKNSHNFSIRVSNVSKLFWDNDNTPILAVNDVTLGIKQGSLFGFLGANGAGKTTLINMIMGMVPASTGTIEINGIDINDIKDPSILCVCPQFNDHLVPEMTPLEHFTFYSYIYSLDKFESQERIREMIISLEMENILNRRIKEIAFGDIRKVSIALTFFSPATVILLDEPTASLESNSKSLVHELIKKKKQSKTILLCTHLLNEADLLCDKISIMIKGNIYIVDTPLNLQHKFGTSIKIDIMLSSDQDAETKCHAFITNNLPTATLSITRTKSRIYKISNQSINFSQLFQIMEEGRNGDNGFIYFTCSSSSLEQAFLEIVKMSESGHYDASSIIQCTTDNIL